MNKSINSNGIVKKYRVHVLTHSLASPRSHDTGGCHRKFRVNGQHMPKKKKKKRSPCCQRKGLKWRNCRLQHLLFSVFAPVLSCIQRLRQYGFTCACRSVCFQSKLNRLPHCSLLGSVCFALLPFSIQPTWIVRLCVCMRVCFSPGGASDGGLTAHN